jgi:hypothetical protein
MLKYEMYIQSKHIGRNDMFWICKKLGVLNKFFIFLSV